MAGFIRFYQLKHPGDMGIHEIVAVIKRSCRRLPHRLHNLHGLCEVTFGVDGVGYLG